MLDARLVLFGAWRIGGTTFMTRRITEFARCGNVLADVLAAVLLRAQMLRSALTQRDQFLGNIESRGKSSLVAVFPHRQAAVKAATVLGFECEFA